eukprot:gnl/TRDRNA2_/TRDRNA2_162388_c0_seq3.p1 gnl/TRDRNA2_/TRDRNA2_162388_c0~~gnl/TRDRNA2_/TRDRNA2_162388_c0_seq3.p1  ORF type:complete len:109 (+),score=2.39 gnl/TRDRNA2_/TRDRNA2_162388_c0_seq3:74-400(+)
MGGNVAVLHTFHLEDQHTLRADIVVTKYAVHQRSVDRQIVLAHIAQEPSCRSRRASKRMSGWTLQRSLLRKVLGDLRLQNLHRRAPLVALLAYTDCSTVNSSGLHRVL